MVSAMDLILVAFFTGIGAGIGNPIGQWIFEKFIKHSILREDLVNLLKKDVNGIELLKKNYNNIKKKEE